MLKNLLILIFGTLILAAILNPWVYTALNYFYPEHGWPFSRVYNRVAMFSALIWLIILWKSFSVGKVKDLLSYKNYNLIIYHLTLGVIISSVTVFLAVLVLINFMNILIIANYDQSIVFSKAIKFLATGLLVGLIEELFFRGVLFNYLKEQKSFFFAAITTSLIYSIVHFIAPINSWVANDINALTGLNYLLAVLGQMFSIKMLPAMFGLALVGFVLAYVMHKTNSIYYCIGLHAGWVLSLKMTNLLTDTINVQDFMVGHTSNYYLVTLPIAWVSIASVAGYFYFCDRKIKVN
jgi:membrane protease YdiL (CAAX protease family)